MKTHNRLNKRFCDVGDMFMYGPNDIIVCSRYYKYSVMIYKFRKLIPEENKHVKVNFIFTRNLLNKLWEDENLKNVPKEIYAKLLLSQ